MNNGPDPDFFCQEDKELLSLLSSSSQYFRPIVSSTAQRRPKGPIPCERPASASDLGIENLSLEEKRQKPKNS